MHPSIYYLEDIYTPIKLYLGAYLRKIVPMTSTQIAFYIYYLLIISTGI